MDLSPSRRQAGRNAFLASWRIVTIVATATVVFLITAFAVAQIQIQVNGAAAPSIPSESEDDPLSVYLPTDRTLSRGMSRAEERLNEREYNEALDFLQKILDQDEDTFLDNGANAESRRGLKATARRLIAELPPAGRETYELLHATAARRGLQAALESGDREKLAGIVRRYLFTPAGYEAALILAQTEFDRGHPLAAASIYQQLAQDTRAAAQFEPQLSVLAAVSWSAAGHSDRAAHALRDIATHSPGATIGLAGREVELPDAGDSDADLLAWLTKTVGVTAPLHAGSKDWLTLRGGPLRNAEFRGGAPHLSARWQARVVNDPRYETFLESRADQLAQSGIVTIPAARPIAAGDCVLMRTPQNLVAIDWQTGKRLWETREDDPGDRDRILSDYSAGNTPEEWPGGGRTLEQRVWDDSLTMSLSSDGERVYALHENEPANREQTAAWGMGVPFGGPFDTMTAPTNRLTAYELATEGKLAWEIDGANEPGELSGAYFLGPPLAIDGSLFVLAEMRSAVYLIALDPRTGKQQWQQQLAGLEQGITLDPQRRLTAATPSHAAGILICPTSAGIVVAVDIIQREFAWVYRYPRQADKFAHMRNAWHGRPEVSAARDNNQWLDGTVIIDEGRVFLTPPESTELHCIDLSTGKLLWKRPRDKAIYVACVDRGVVLLIEPEAVSAIRAEDGAQAWTKDHVDLPADALPSGVGYLSEGRYYLPISTRQVLAIDTQDGSVAGAIASASAADVGNLICHRGSVLSQSPLLLDKFDQIEVLRKRAEAALAENPRDAAAIRDLAEMRHLDGKLDAAVRMLKQAHEIAPEDPATREMLADCLLEALAANYELHKDDLPLLRTIVYRPQQEVELLRIEAAGLEAAGNPMEAFAVLLKLAEATAADPVALAIEPGHSARSDAWIRARLNQLWTAASAEDRVSMEQQLAARRDKWNQLPSVHDFRSYLSQFDGLAGTDEVRLQLVRRLMAERELLDAEIELLKLERSTDPQYQAAAAVLFTEWLLMGERLEEARAFVTSLESRSPTALTFDGKTPQSLLEEYRFELTGDSKSVARDWPRGEVVVDVEPTASPTRRDMTKRAFVEFQQGMRRLRVEQLYRRPLSRAANSGSSTATTFEAPRLGASQWLISQDGSRLVGRNGLGVDTFRYVPDRGTAPPNMPPNSDWVQAAQLGDLLYVTVGGQILALDTRQLGDDEADVIWQAFPGGRYSGPALQPHVMQRAWSRRNVQGLYHTSSGRKRAPAPAALAFGALGPVTPYSVVLQEQRQIRAVDPVNGETLWSRTDIPAGCELFGDEELVLAANMGEGQIYVVNARDGELVDRRDMPPAPWLLTAGRNVCRVVENSSTPSGHKSLEIVDVVSGAVLYSAEYNGTARMTTVEPNFVAVVEAPDREQLAKSVASTLVNVPGSPPVDVTSGRFHLIDVLTGRRVIDQPLADVSLPRAIHLMETDDQLFLLVNGELRQQPSRPIGPDYPLIDGQVYAFDLVTGTPAWPGPALIERRGISLTQPTDIPMLVFVDRAAKRDAAGGGSQLRLLCIDKDTGATIYRNNALPDTSGTHFRIRATRGEARNVSVEMSTRTVRLTFTDKPRPPAPPSNDLVEAPRKSLGRGLLSVGQRMSDMIQGAIQNPGRNEWQPGPAQAPPPNPVEPPLDDD